MSDTYWAAEPPDRLARRALDKVKDYRRWFRTTGHAEKALKGWRYANGWTDAGESSSRLQAGGERGQLVKTVINGLRPLRQRTLAMVLNSAPSMRPVAANSDSAAREQADASRGVLEHIHRVHRRDVRDRKALTLALDMGEGALVIEWDGRLGEPVAVEPVLDAQQQPVLDAAGKPTFRPAAWMGDFRYWLASAFDVYRDVGLRDWEDASWVVVRRWVSKWRLAALYTEKAGRILAVGTGREAVDPDDYFDLRMLDGMTNESDMVAEYVLWHLDTPELPGGLEFRFLADGTWLAPPGGYPYDGDMLPVMRLVPDDVALTSLGYTSLFDALGLSDLLNAVVSGMATNVSKGAVPPILNPKGSGLSKGTSIGSGHLVLDINSPELAPRYMEPPQTPPEAYRLMEVLERLRLESAGLNETALGRPPFSGMAAQAMALLDAKADEYQDSLRKGYLEYLSRAATFELRVLKRYAHEERIAQVTGKAKQWMVRAYNSESLRGVDAVHVEPVGQAARTLSGKLGTLETLANFNVPLSPEQIIELLQTGQYESDFEAPLATRYGLREENEALRDGSAPHRALITDKHWLHIAEHLALLDSPEARRDESGEMLSRVLEAVEEHLGLWRDMPMDLLSLLGGPPPPPPGPPAGMVAEMGMRGPALPSGEEMPPDAGGGPLPDMSGAMAALEPGGEPLPEPTMPESPPMM